MTLPPPAPFAAVFVLGLVSQIAQVLLLREFLMVFHGNELSIGIILSAWLAWTGLGSWLGARLVEHVRQSLTLLCASAAGVAVALPSTILLIRSLRGFIDVFPGAHLSLTDVLLSCFVLMAPVCLLLGAQFVMLCRIWRESDATRQGLADRVSATSTGKTYVVEAAGNMVAGILFTFVLVRLLGSPQTAFLTGLLMLSMAAAMRIQGRSAGGRPRFALHFSVLAVVVSAVGGAGFFGMGELDRHSAARHWGRLAPDHELVEIRQSKHGDIAVLRRGDQYNFFQSGNLVFSAAGRKAVAPGLEDQEALAFAHLAMVQHPRPERVLLIGGVFRGMLAEIARHPVKHVDAVELDAVLTTAARMVVSEQNVRVLDDPRIRLVLGDARLFVKRGGAERYDVIVVDAPDPTTAVLNRVYTREFFQEAQKLLHPDGILVIGAVSTPDLRGLAVANRNATIRHTLNEVFDRVLAVGDRFLVFVAARQTARTTLDPAVLQRRFEDRKISVEGFSGLHYHVLLEESSLRRINWVLMHHGRSPRAHLTGPPAPPLRPTPVEEQLRAEAALAPVDRQGFSNTDFRPIGYVHTLMFWDELTRAGSLEILRSLLHVRPFWALPLLAGPMIGVLLLRGLRRSSRGRLDLSFAVHHAAWTTGMSTMLMQVALLFSFQSLYGFIYETIGLIVAVFMSGLAAGAYWGSRKAAIVADPSTLALIQGGMALLAWGMALTLPSIAGMASPALILALFGWLTFLAGLINGIDFPLTAACSTALTNQPERSAGRIYGLELIGACFGAILASAVVAPIMGVTACFLLAGAVNATAGIVLLLSRRKQWLHDQLPATP